MATETAMQAPSSGGIFWGWYIFAGAVLGQLVTVGFQAQVIGVFLNPMIDDLGWTRAEYLLAQTVGFVLGGIAGFLIGPLLDRYGTQRVMLIGGTVAGFSLLGVSQVNEVWQWVLLRGVVSAVALFMVGPFVVNTALAKWFVVRRASVVALASIGASLGGVIPPLVATAAIDQWDWRAGWVVLGVSTWVLILPVALLMRRQPEDYGWLPDGKTGREEPTEAELKMQEMMRRDFANSYTRAEAAKQPSLWILAIAFSLMLAGVGSFFAQAIPLVTDAGFTRGEAATLFAAQGMVALFSKFWWAWAMQRYSGQRLTLVSAVSMATAVILLVALKDGAMAPLFLPFGVWGFGVGGIIPLSEFIWASFFGRRHIGAVRSTALPITVILGGAGPQLVGLYRDQVGDYDGAFIGMAVAWLIGGTVVALMERPPSKALPGSTAP